MTAGCDCGVRLWGCSFWESRINLVEARECVVFERVTYALIYEPRVESVFHNALYLFVRHSRALRVRCGLHGRVQEGVYAAVEGCGVQPCGVYLRPTLLAGQRAALLRRVLPHRLHMLSEGVIACHGDAKGRAKVTLWVAEASQWCHKGVTKGGAIAGFWVNCCKP